jgi:hypothetical protein
MLGREIDAPDDLGARDFAFDYVRAVMRHDFLRCEHVNIVHNANRRGGCSPLGWLRAFLFQIIVLVVLSLKSQLIADVAALALFLPSLAVQKSKR